MPKPRPGRAGRRTCCSGARVCASLDEALQGTVYALAVSARRRELAYVSADARSAAQALVAAAQEGEVAIVFGTEMSGLTNEEILQCSAVAHIPADPGYSSLNLAAAVQVLAYEARVAALGGQPLPAAEAAPARHEDVENFYVHLEQSLLASGFLDPANPEAPDAAPAAPVRPRPAGAGRGQHPARHAEFFRQKYLTKKLGISKIMHVSASAKSYCIIRCKTVH